MDDNNLKNKKLLILAGADVHSKVVKAAKDLGAYTIVTDNLSPEAAPAKKIADEYWMINIFDTDRIIEKARENHIDGVLSFCIDPAQLPYQRIASELGLPCYATKKQFEIFTNKTRFKEFCIDNGVSVVPSYSLQQVLAGEAKFPLLVKPSESRGSRGQTICRNLNEIDAAIQRAISESKDSNYIIERYMEGAQDMSFSYVVLNRVPYLLKIGDRYLGNKRDNLDRQHIATILPSSHAREYKENVEPKVARMINNLGIEFGAVFLQGFWEDGDVYFYDPGLRFPGGDFDIALRATTGYDNMKTFVNFALTGQGDKSFGSPMNAYQLNGQKVMILSICGREGRIEKIMGFEEIASDPRIISASLRYKEGDVVPSSGDIRQRIAEFVAVLPDDADSPYRFAQYVYDMLIFLDEEGDDMKISKLVK